MPAVYPHMRSPSIRAFEKSSDTFRARWPAACAWSGRIPWPGRDRHRESLLDNLDRGEDVANQ